MHSKHKHVLYRGKNSGDFITQSQYAFFRTCAVPSGSKLDVSARQWYFSDDTRFDFSVCSSCCLFSENICEKCTKCTVGGWMISEAVCFRSEGVFDSDSSLWTASAGTRGSGLPADPCMSCCSCSQWCNTGLSRR